MDYNTPIDPATDIPENRRPGMTKIILLSGGFDPVHIGHVRMFKEASIFGDKVFVGLNSDEWLTKKKGKPFMPFEERREILQAIKYIDHVFSFSDDEQGTALKFLQSMNEAYIKDRSSELYFGNGGDRTNDTTPEKMYCKSNGIKLLYELGGGKIQSSSKLTGVK